MQKMLITSSGRTIYYSGAPPSFARIRYLETAPRYMGQIITKENKPEIATLQKLDRLKEAVKTRDLTRGEVVWAGKKGHTDDSKPECFAIYNAVLDVLEAAAARPNQGPKKVEFILKKLGDLDTLHPSTSRLMSLLGGLENSPEGFVSKLPQEVLFAIVREMGRQAREAPDACARNLATGLLKHIKLWSDSPYHPYIGGGAVAKVARQELASITTAA